MLNYELEDPRKMVEEYWIKKFCLPGDSILIGTDPPSGEGIFKFKVIEPSVPLSSAA